MRPGRTAAMLAAGWLAGCGGGPEVRVTSDPAAWRPTRIAVLPPLAAAGAVPASRALPGGLTPPTSDEACAAVREVLQRALAASATPAEVRPADLTRTPTAAALADRLARQYLDARLADPEVARAAAAAAAADAVLVTAVLKYGPEVEGDAQQMAQSVSTRVGTTDVGISSATSRVVIWYNAQVRCALVRGSDGAMLWDAGCRERMKNTLLHEATQDSTLHAAVEALVAAFPWRREEEDVPAVPR